MENNNDFFGVDEKYIPKSENNDKEYIKNDEKNIYESENVNVEYTKKDKKKFNVFLIILLVLLPVIICIITVIVISTMGVSIMKLNFKNDDIKEIAEVQSNLHGIRDNIEVASEIHSSAKDAINESLIQMQNQENEMFNAQFIYYKGEQKGSSIKALYQAVIANNQTYQNDDEKEVKIKGITDISEVESKKTYNVDFNYNSVGYINEIVITEAE